MDPTPSPSAGVPLPSRRRPSSAPARILEATEQLLLEAGVDGVSIRKVSERSGYSAPTIYHHFGDKEGLVDALLEERFAEIHAVLVSLAGQPDATVRLREMARAFMRFSLENPSHYQLLMAPGLGHVEAVSSAQASRELVKSALEELAREGTLATPDIEAAFQLLWAVLHGVISLYLAGPDAGVSEGLDELVFDTIEKGLLRRKETGE